MITCCGTSFFNVHAVALPRRLLVSVLLHGTFSKVVVFSNCASLSSNDHVLFLVNVVRGRDRE